jgi:hypothetical protein
MTSKPKVQKVEKLKVSWLAKKNILNIIKLDV